MGSTSLSAQVDVTHHIALSSSFWIQETESTDGVSTSVTVRNVGADALSSTFIVQSPAGDEAHGSFIVRHTDSGTVSSRFWVGQTTVTLDFSVNPDELHIYDATLSASFSLRQVGEPYYPLSSAFAVAQFASDPEGVPASVYVMYPDSETLSSSMDEHPCYPSR